MRRLCLVKHEQDEHAQRGDSQLVSFLRRLHRDYCIAQGEADRYFSPLVLLRVKSVKLLELVVDIRRIGSNNNVS